MTTFYLIRHAHATWTPDENRPLSERGQRDARRVAKLLKDAVEAAPVAAIYASTARRAQQTVAPFAARLGLPVQITPALDERRLCAGAADDFQVAVRATWADFSFAHPGGESNTAAQERALCLVHNLMGGHAGAQIVLSTHGNLLALIVQAYLPTHGYTFWQALTMPDLYRLAFAAGGSGAGVPVLERLWTVQAPELQ
jgi:2,3-bisphosphoglycerate-dependent phosphoglycerate mutase